MIEDAALSPHVALRDGDSLAEARALSVEFPPFMANHTPMVLWAMGELGGTEADRRRFLDAYLVSTKVALPVPSPKPITVETWQDHLGDRRYEAAYRAFFAGELARMGERALIDAYLPQLLPGFAASALHAFMRLTYARLTAEPTETATALAYWAATYLALGSGVGAAPRTRDPAGVLALMTPVAAFRNVETEIDLLWHFMRAIAARPAFAPVHDWLEVGPDTVSLMARDSLRLFAATMDFSALHALTGTHWLRVLLPLLPDPEIAIRQFWQAIAALYPKIGFPVPLSAEEAAAMALTPCPDWAEISSAAVRSDEEHDISLVYSARMEMLHYGDRLYQVVAARRLGLID